MFLNFFIELNIVLTSTILNTMQSKTKQTKLAMHESAMLKNCGTKHLKIPPTKLPNILLGIAKILINKMGLIIMLLTPKNFAIILRFNMLDTQMLLPSPTIKAFTPKYLGNKNIDAIKQILPKI